MDVVTRLGRFLLLRHEGSFETSRRRERFPAHLWLALDDSGPVHLLVVDRELVRHEHEREHQRAMVSDCMADAEFVIDAPGVVTGVVSGVFVEEAVAQGVVEGGDVAVEVAVWIAVEVARAVDRMGWRGAPWRLAPHVRLGFDGSVQSWLVWATPGGFGPITPDTMIPLDHGRRFPRDQVRTVAHLLWWLLTGQACDHSPVAELPASDRALPAPLVRLVRAAFSTDLDAGPTSMRELIDQLALFVDADEGRRQTSGFVRGLFPARQRDDVERIEEASLVVMNRARTRLITRGDHFAWCLAGDRTLTDDLTADDEGSDVVATGLDFDTAVAIAAHLGGRIPDEEEWQRLARGGAPGVASARGVDDLCRYWEWTTTPHRGGHVVRGGVWRNRAGPADVAHRSWEDTGATDVAARVVFDD